MFSQKHVNLGIGGRRSKELLPDVMNVIKMSVSCQIATDLEHLCLVMAAMVVWRTPCRKLYMALSSQPTSIVRFDAVNSFIIR